MAKRIKKESVFQLIAMVLTVCAFLAAAYAVSRMIIGKNSNGTDTTTYSRQTVQAPSLLFEGKDYQMRDNMEIILVMGVDDYESIGDNGSYINSSQADVLYVFAIDHANKTYQAIQLNRETMTGVKQITGAGTEDIEMMQLCLAHSFGRNDKERCRNTVDAVSGLIFNVPIDHYISLNLSSIAVLNEQVGGVTVTIPAGMDTLDPAFVEGASVRLDDDQAESFIRARMELENDTNEFRMQRQQIFLSAWKQQAGDKMNADSGFALNLVLALSDYMVSDMTANALTDFANQLSEYEDLGTLYTQGETLSAGKDRPFSEYYVDEADLERKVIILFYEEAEKQTES